jgi:hypothetical protein
MASMLSLLVLATLAVSGLAGSVSVESAQQMNRRAIDLAQSGKLREAKPLFEEAIRLYPTNSEFHNNLGVTLLRMQDYVNARRSFNEALRLDPSSPDARENLKELEQWEAKSGVRTSSGAPGFTAHPVVMESFESERPSSSGGGGGGGGGDSGAAPVERKSKPKDPKWENVMDPLRYTRKPKKRQPDLPRIPFSLFFSKEYAEYAAGRKPFILTGAMTDWPLEKQWREAELSARFPDAIVDFYPHNMDRSDAHPYLVPFADALREFHRPSGRYPSNQHIPGVYIQWNINFTNWLDLTSDIMKVPYPFRRDEEWLERCLATPELINEYTRKVHWRMMLIGTKGAGMFNHQDVLRTSSYQAQVAGAKRWHICAPDQAPYLYSAGEVDCFYPNYEKVPLFEHANCYQSEVRAGEMIFYPKDYWHQTENLETPSISISASILDENNWRDIMAELKNECAFHKYKWNFSPELCKALENCYAFWQSRFEPDLSAQTCRPGDKHQSHRHSDEL